MTLPMEYIKVLNKKQGCDRGSAELPKHKLMNMSLLTRNKH